MRRSGRQFLLPVLATLGRVATAQAQTWPPSDPGEARTAVKLDAAWASRVRDIRDFALLQRAAGARGHIAEIAAGENPHAVYEWTSTANGSHLRVVLFEAGGFGATLRPASGEDAIIFNSFGAFVCAACLPPVDACGHRPSWVPHDLHWDNFDCRCTLTGPQSLSDARC